MQYPRILEERAQGGTLLSRRTRVPQLELPQYTATPEFGMDRELDLILTASDPNMLDLYVWTDVWGPPRDIFVFPSLLENWNSEYGQIYA